MFGEWLRTPASLNKIKDNAPLLRSPVMTADFSFLIRIDLHRLHRAHGNSFILLYIFEYYLVVQDTYIRMLSTNVVASDGSPDSKLTLTRCYSGQRVNENVCIPNQTSMKRPEALSQVSI